MILKNSAGSGEREGWEEGEAAGKLTEILIGGGVNGQCEVLDW